MRIGRKAPISMALAVALVKGFRRRHTMAIKLAAEWAESDRLITTSIEEDSND
jgi:hypothetical protein